MFSLKGFLIGMTQGLNATLSGDPDEPFSSRTAREASNGSRFWIITEALINLGFAIATGERNHCANSLE
jgi:hypothetical protein